MKVVFAGVLTGRIIHGRDTEEGTQAFAVSFVSERKKQIIGPADGGNERDLIDPEFTGTIIPDGDHPDIRAGQIPDFDPGPEALPVDHRRQGQDLTGIGGQG